MINIYKVFTFLLLLICTQSLIAQNKSDSSRFKTVAAGPEYQRSALYQSLWGKNYRREWITPVIFPITKLDTLQGGIVKFKIGGGHQSKSLLICYLALPF